MGIASAPGGALSTVAGRAWVGMRSSAVAAGRVAREAGSAAEAPGGAVARGIGRTRGLDRAGGG
ncbi:MAG: hypothetical protein ACREKQ_13500, partial [Candidatus Rokuibacteriota bacterium]